MKKVTRATEPYGCASSGAASGQDSGGRRHPVTESGGVSTAARPVYRLIRVAFRWLSVVPPAGFEPALTAPEAVALSPELRGLKDRSKATSLGEVASGTQGPSRRPNQDHLGQVVART